MNDYAGVYDICQNLDDIRNQIQILTKEFLHEINFPLVSAFTALDEGGAINLGILAELSHAELQHYQRPIFLLSEICRLLIKSGDTRAFKLCLRLSHVIYSFKCQFNESNYISHLYKGISQIGLGSIDLGVKNVQYGISMTRRTLLSPIDQALGYWALMNASIRKRDLRSASQLALEWKEAALKGRLTSEKTRAALVGHLLLLVQDRAETLSPEMKKLFLRPPMTWESVIVLLREWTDAVVAGRRPEEFECVEPLPLLLGVNWQVNPSENYAYEEQADEFALLCQRRHSFCAAETIAELSVDELQRYAELLARWNLSEPLYDLVKILKKKDAGKSLEYLMNRRLGKNMLERVMTNTPLEPAIFSQDKAIILAITMRHFSQLGASYKPQEMFDLLNPIVKILIGELENAGGTILKLSDARMSAVFNALTRRRSELVEILGGVIRSLHGIHAWNAQSHHTDRPEIQIGIGIHKGELGIGFLGGLERSHFTVVGKAINLAAGIEDASKTLPGKVIISERCFQHAEPDIWRDPQKVNFSLRDLGRHTLREERERLRLFGVNPLLRYWVDFVPMGFVAHPEEGVVYLDTGRSNAPGIIDRHFPGQHAQSACELLNDRPELLLNHIRNVPLSQIEFRLHKSPDFDCAATLYTAYELMEQEPRREILQELADYVGRAIHGELPNTEHLSDSLYGIFVAHQRQTQMFHKENSNDFLLLEAGLRAIDAAVYLMERYPGQADFSTIFGLRQDCFVEEWKLIQEDLPCYHEDLILRGHPYKACVNGRSGAVAGLWLDHPESLFYTLWAKADGYAAGGKGYQFLAIDLSEPRKNRFTIQVHPEAETNLRGLGELLELHESRKRKDMGKERPIHPIRYPSDNADPWYFGQGHAYTIVDSPHAGTVLTAAEVQKIHESWKGAS